MTRLSKRKLESYKRAEVLAQVSRQLMVRWHNPSQELVDLWTGALADWMAVTGKLKYDLPKRRGKGAAKGKGYTSGEYLSLPLPEKRVKK